MNEQFVEYYRRELTYIRERAGEFAQDYPKIAARLELDASGTDTCPDPFVERLLEGFAFLAARVQLKFDAEYPRLVQGLFDTILPNYLAPLPSMAIVRIEPDFEDADLAEGYEVPRHTELRGRLGRGERTPCVYRTAHPLNLLPLQIEKAAYHSREIGVHRLPASLEAKATIHIRLRATAGVQIQEITADELEFFVRGGDLLPEAILENIFAHGIGVGYRGGDEHVGVQGVIDPAHVSPSGLDSGQSMLPIEKRLYSGYRLLREYFAFRQRFHYFRISGLREAFQKIEGNCIDLFLLLKQANGDLDSRIDNVTFNLFTTPVVNLFERRADPIQLRRGSTEYPVIVDKTRSFDFEVFSVSEVTGRGNLAEESMTFRPFFFASERLASSNAFFSLRRTPRSPTAQERRFGKLSSYTGSEVYISLVDGSCIPYSPDLQQLSLRVLCTNRHLPLSLSTSGKPDDFTCELGGPVTGFSCIVDPTSPVPSITEGEFAWRLISHLSLNHYSLVGTENGKGAVPMRELLRLYGDLSRKDVQQELEGLVDVISRPVTRRLPGSGPIAFGRGLQVKLVFNEDRMEGIGMYSIGLVLSRFLTRYVTINSFIETIIASEQRGEVMEWQRLSGISPMI
jgi:type VI secretion system protein ImpG